jgi:hypothetical protein
VEQFVPRGTIPAHAVLRGRIVLDWYSLGDVNRQRDEIWQGAFGLVILNPAGMRIRKVLQHFRVSSVQARIAQTAVFLADKP